MSKVLELEETWDRINNEGIKPYIALLEEGAEKSNISIDVFTEIYE